MPRYERTHEGNTEAWEIHRSDKALHIAGSSAPPQTKVFGSTSDAQRAMSQAIEAKLAAGFVEVASVEISEAEHPSNPALEHAIYEQPDRREVWMVYADWLASQGDPRSELIAAGTDTSEVERVLWRHRDYLMGRFGPGRPLSAYVEAAPIFWYMGFLRHLRVSLVPGHLSAIAGVLREVLAHPSARFLRKLDLGVPIGHADGGLWPDALGALAEAVRPTLNDLSINDGVTLYEVDEHRIGSLSGLWAALPGLRTLQVRGNEIALGAIEAPGLRNLVLWGSPLPPGVLQELAGSQLPRLERLELRCAEGLEGWISAPGLSQLLLGEATPRLEYLGLMNLGSGDLLPAYLARTPLLASIRQLSLQDCGITDTGARALLQHADRFAHLRRLDLEGNQISQDLARRLESRLSRTMVLLGRQTELYEGVDE